MGFIRNKALYIKNNIVIFRVQNGREREEEVSATEQEREAQHQHEERKGEWVGHSGHGSSGS